MAVDGCGPAAVGHRNWRVSLSRLLTGISSSPSRATAATTAAVTRIGVSEWLVDGAGDGVWRAGAAPIVIVGIDARWRPVVPGFGAVTGPAASVTPSRRSSAWAACWAAVTMPAPVGLIAIFEIARKPGAVGCPGQLSPNPLGITTSSWPVYPNDSS